jgi:hypothetical protein
MSFSNTYDTTNPGSGVLNREQLMDELTILAPQETPVLSSLNKKKATATYFEWGVDKLSTPSTAGVVEGSDVTSFTDKFAGQARLGNYIQTFRRDYMVSTLQQAVDSVGPARIARAEMKSIKELKRDIEATLLSANDRQAGTEALPYKTRGLGSWIDSAGPSDVPSAYRTPSGSIWASGTFNETALNGLITSIYRVTGNTNSLTLVADTALRRVITDFARTSASTDYSVRKVNYNGSSAEIKLMVEIYQSDHGMVTIVNMNPDCAPDTTNKDTGYLINNEYAAIAELIPLTSTRLPNLGGGERGYVEATLGLEVAHPGAHGKITSLT